MATAPASPSPISTSPLWTEARGKVPALANARRFSLPVTEPLSILREDVPA